ncbi:MAG: tetratricopeptide repeat protein [Candidatus Omnitrophica bacterium]|nr:tetratricopeptide repeat protein [Candidatus Omnitrophota bacterium]MDD5653901.1 tetratricopeptide repeat protein [Candidatus Omnitrophota bacterium]
MAMKKIVALAVIALFCSSLAFAAEKKPLYNELAREHFTKGVKAQEGGNFTEAEDFYQKALLMDPSNVTLRKFVMHNRAVIYAKEGDLQKAETAFDALLRMDPNYKTAELNLGITYDKRKSRLEALEYWAKMFKLEDQKPKDFAIEEGQGLEE